MDNNLKKGIELIKQVENLEAIKYLERALETDSVNAEIHRHLGLAFNNLGDVEKAQFHWKKAVDLDSNHHQTLWSLGNLYEAKGNYGQAFDLYSRAARAADAAGDNRKARRYEEWVKIAKKKTESLNTN